VVDKHDNQLSLIGEPLFIPFLSKMYSPLIAAVFRDHREIFDYLMENGADVNLATEVSIINIIIIIYLYINVRYVLSSTQD